MGREEGEERGGREGELRVYNTIKLAHSQNTVEPPNRGHFGTAAFVLSSEVVFFSEVV